MLHPSLIKFLKDLQTNNNKNWFEQNRNRYEKAKEEFQVFVTVMIKGIASFDKSIADLQAKECTFRINRDVRFSKDKKPYKNNLAAYFNKDGKKGLGSGYYIHIEPGKSFVAGGIWMPEPNVLSKIRQEIDYNFDEWNKILSAAAFKKNFNSLEKEGSLVRPPKGYDPGNPAIEFIKMKSFIVSKPFTDADATAPGFDKKIFATFKSMKPLIDFLNRAID